MPNVPLFHPLLLAALLAAGCSRSDPETSETKEKTHPAVPVLAQAVERQDVPISINAIGKVEPFATVAIKPQIAGQISQVQFTEGQEVQAGDLLVTIDKRPFEVALRQAQASLDQARASALNAEKQAKRYTELSQRGAVTKEQFDQIKLNQEMTAAAVHSAEAALRNAQLQLEYCTIRSPLSGRAGKRLVDSGNVVTANATDLVVINQIEPIQVSFTVAERYLGEISRYLAAPQGITAKATPEGTAKGTAGQSARGAVTFLDNAVKPGSGTVELKATFPNKDRLLWPGQFVAVELTLAIQKDAIVAASNAVLTGQRGQYVFVIKGDHTTEARPVKIDRIVGDRAVIAEGLKEGEQVVVDGQSRLLPGARVEIKAGLAADLNPEAHP